MSVQLSSQMRKLLDAIRIIHAHGTAPLNERLFQAMDLIYEDSGYTLELYGTNDGSHIAATDIPFSGASKEEIMKRAGELVPLEHPLFPHLLKRDPSPVRLSDYTTHRQFSRTALYNEIFKNVGARHQMAIPIFGPSHVGAVTVGGLEHRADYTEDDLLIASLLAPQIATALDVERHLQTLTPEISTAAKTDYTQLRRLGMTRREAEVMYWVAEGKRDNEIAVILGISVRTVNHHVKSILTKLRVETRTAAVTAVLQKGYDPPDHSTL